MTGEREADAAEWLSAELADRAWRPAREVKTKARAAGHAPATLQRAKRLLGVEHRREGYQGEWRRPPLPEGPRTVSDGRAEVERIRAEVAALGTRAPTRSADRPRNPRLGEETWDVAAVEAKLARDAAARVADALPAPSCACDGPLLASDGSCVRCGREAP